MINSEELRVLHSFETLQTIFRSMGLREKFVCIALSIALVAGLTVSALLSSIGF